MAISDRAPPLERAPLPVVCLGEALVDLTCEQPVASLGEAPAFVPRLGGSLANIAVGAARHGADVEMIGGAGDDEWGRWLRDALVAEGVGVARFGLARGTATSHAFVTVSNHGEPSFAFYGGPGHPSEQAGAVLAEALAPTRGVLVVGSDSIVGAGEREITARALRTARERDWHVLCDPNLRPNRWSVRSRMLSEVRRLIAGATTIKLNAVEAHDLTGIDDPVAAARSLIELGPRVVVVTSGVAGATLVRADHPAESWPAVAARVVDATGAGDAVAGVLAATLAAAGESGLGPAMPVAMAAAGAVVARWGALDGLPERSRAAACLAAATAL